MNFILEGILHVCIIWLIPGIVVAKGDWSDIRNVSLDSLLNIRISTAAKYEQKLSNAPASISIVTSEDINRYGYRTLDDVLASIRGFYTSYDRNYTYLGVRGFSRPTDYNNRILLLIDGNIANENVFGSAAIGTDMPLNLDLIDRIEVVRGPGSALYGTSAMFAVINIITKKANQIDSFNFSAAMGSYGRIHGSSLFGKEFTCGLKMVLSGLWTHVTGQNLYFKEYDQPTTHHGIANNLDGDHSYGLLATCSYKSLTLQWRRSAREKEIPTGAYGITFNDPDSRTIDRYEKFVVKYNKKFGSTKDLQMSGFYDYYCYEGTFPYDTPIDDYFETAKGSVLGGEFRFHWSPRSNNQLILGSEYRYNNDAAFKSWEIADTTDTEKINFDDNFPFNVFSFYLQDDYQLFHNLSLTLGLRSDSYSTGVNSWSPRAAIIYNLSKCSTFKFLYGAAFRVPGVYEVNYQAEGEAKCNKNLKPEQIKTTEIAWEQQVNGNVSGVISCYQFEMNDLIDTMIDPDDSLTQFMNISKIKARGLEAGFKIHLKNGISGYLNWIIQNTRNELLQQRLTNSPVTNIKFGASIPVLNYLWASMELHYDSGRICLIRTKTTTPVLLTNANFSLLPLANHLTISLLIKNVFNVAYQTPGGFEHIKPIAHEDLPAINQDRRNFTIKLDYRF